MLSDPIFNFEIWLTLCAVGFAAGLIDAIAGSNPKDDKTRNDAIHGQRLSIGMPHSYLIDTN